MTCRLTAKNRDQLRNPTLGNRVWATFFTACYAGSVSREWCWRSVGVDGRVGEQRPQRSAPAAGGRRPVLARADLPHQDQRAQSRRPTAPRQAARLDVVGPAPQPPAHPRAARVRPGTLRRPFVSDVKLCCCRRTARRATSVEILSNCCTAVGTSCVTTNPLRIKAKMELQHYGRPTCNKLCASS